MFFAKLLILTGTVVPQFFLALLATSTADIPTCKNTNYVVNSKSANDNMRSKISMASVNYYMHQTKHNAMLRNIALLLAEHSYMQNKMGLSTSQVYKFRSGAINKPIHYW